MSTPDGSEEMTPEELQALAEELDRQAEPGAKRREVPEKVLLALGGKKADATIVFGSEGEFQLIFRPSQKAAARWTFSIPPVPISGYDIHRELTKSGLKLWVWDKEKGDKEKGKPSVAYRAVEQLLDCHVEIERQFRRELLLVLLSRHREQAKQDGEAAEDALYIYPKPLLETSREERHALTLANEQLAMVSERLETVSDQRLRAQGAIVLVVEALSKGLGRKLQKAFDLLQRDQWERDIQKLWDCTMFLAATLQRPPAKAELRKCYDPDERKESSQFSRLLSPAGLLWLPSMALLRRALSLAT